MLPVEVSCTSGTGHYEKLAPVGMLLQAWDCMRDLICMHLWETCFGTGGGREGGGEMSSCSPPAVRGHVRGGAVRVVRSILRGGFKIAKLVDVGASQLSKLDMRIGGCLLRLLHGLIWFLISGA